MNGLWHFCGYFSACASASVFVFLFSTQCSALKLHALLLWGGADHVLQVLALTSPPSSAMAIQTVILVLFAELVPHNIPYRKILLLAWFFWSVFCTIVGFPCDSFVDEGYHISEPRLHPLHHITLWQYYCQDSCMTPISSALDGALKSVYFWFHMLSRGLPIITTYDDLHSRPRETGLQSMQPLSQMTPLSSGVMLMRSHNAGSGACAAVLQPPGPVVYQRPVFLCCWTVSYHIVIVSHGVPRVTLCAAHTVQCTECMYQPWFDHRLVTYPPYGHGPYGHAWAGTC